MLRSVAGAMVGGLTPYTIPKSRWSAQKADGRSTGGWIRTNDLQVMSLTGIARLPHSCIYTDDHW